MKTETKKLTEKIVLGGGAFVIILFPLIASGLQGTSYFLSIGKNIFLYAAFALSWDMLARTGQVSFAHPGFFGLGAYISAILFKDAGVAWMFSIFISLIACMLIAFALGRVTLRLKGLYFAIATLAFTLVMTTVVTQLDSITHGTAGITLPQFFNGNEYAIFYFFVFFAGVVVFLSEYVQRSKYNYSFTAIRSNEEVAKVVGVDVVKDKVLIFTVASGIAALLGMFYAYTNNFIDPESTFTLEIGTMGLAIAVLGGLYTTVGPIIGAIILVILQEILSNIVDTGYMLVYGLVIILVILYLPKGVVGLWKKMAEKQS